MNPETVFDLLVEANPVPDRRADTKTSSTVAGGSHHPESWSETMQTIEPDLVVTASNEPPRRPTWLAAAAAAAVIAVAIAVGLVVTRDGDSQPVITSDSEQSQTDQSERNEESAPAETDTTDPDRENSAVAVAAAYHEAINAGDVDRLVSLTNPDFSVVEADRQMYEMLAMTTETFGPWEIGACEPLEATPIYVEVECGIVLSDPIFVALEAAELRSPVRVHDDGSITWLPWRGADFGAVNRAISAYLREFEPDGYSAACDVAAYQGTSVTADGGLVLSGACAELWVPLATDIVAWIEDGRPEA